MSTNNLTQVLSQFLNASHEEALGMLEHEAEILLTNKAIITLQRWGEDRKHDELLYSHLLLRYAMLTTEFTNISKGDRYDLYREALISIRVSLDIFRRYHQLERLSHAEEVLIYLMVVMGALQFRVLWLDVASEETIPQPSAEAITLAFTKHEHCTLLELMDRMKSDQVLGQRIGELILLSPEAEAKERLGNTLNSWMNTKDWEASKVYIVEHADTLLTEEAEQLLQLAAEESYHPLISKYIDLLSKCRNDGIDKAYSELQWPKREVPQVSLLIEWISIADWDVSRAYLEQHQVELLTDQVEELLVSMRQQNIIPQFLSFYISLLRGCRTKGIQMAYREFKVPFDEIADLHIAHLAELLQGWMDTPDWETSKAYLVRYSNVLLTDNAVFTLDMFTYEYPDNATLLLHSRLLQQCRDEGIDTAYTHPMEPKKIKERSEYHIHITQVLIAWIQQPDVAAAKDYIIKHKAILLSDKAEAVLQQLRQANLGRIEIIQHISLLQKCRTQGIDRAYAQFNPLNSEDLQELANVLIKWIQTPNWNASKRYLMEHAGQIMTESTELVLQKLQDDNPYNPNVPLHINLLRQCRQHGIDIVYAQILQPKEVTTELYDKLNEILADWMGTSRWEESKEFLYRHTSKLLTDDAEIALRLFQHNNPQNPMILEHIALLRRCRELGVNAAYSLIHARKDTVNVIDQRLIDMLSLWMKAPSWQASKLFLQQNRERLLTEAAKIALDMIHSKHISNYITLIHINLLKQCQEDSIDDSYRRIEQIEREALFNTLMSMETEAQLTHYILYTPEDKLDVLETYCEQRLSWAGDELARSIQKKIRLFRALRDQISPLYKGILNFVNTDTMDIARAMLLNNPDLLVAAAGRILESLDSSVPEKKQCIEERKALWQQTRYQMHDKSIAWSQPTLHTSVSYFEMTQSDSSSLSAVIPRSRYLIISPQNCAIGDNAITINNFGRIPLLWKTPLEFQRGLTERAVGRAKELLELHKVLQTNNSAAVVSKGSSSAVYGLPGIGKSTLVALYAEQYANYYPGGVVWIKLGPEYISPEQVAQAISRVAVYAYSGDVQTYELLGREKGVVWSDQIDIIVKNSLCTAPVIRMLLSGHGPILVIVDDVWVTSALKPIREALPLDSCLIVTTRDSRVAIDVGKYVELDVLSEDDALQMIQQTLPSMSIEEQKRLAFIVGYHPLALNIALGDLRVRGPDEWRDNIDQLLRLIETGESLDALPLPDDIDREHRLKVVIDFSYQALGNVNDGAEYQKRLVTLGCFPREASFDTSAIAAIWGNTETIARSYLNVFVARALLNRSGEGRWKQHPVLRAFCLAHQSVKERLELSERHAHHYFSKVQAANSSNFYYQLLTDLPNLRAALDWASTEDPALCQALLINSTNLFVSQNLDAEYLRLSKNALEKVQKIADRENRARALLNYGNALLFSINGFSGEDSRHQLKEVLDVFGQALSLLSTPSIDYTAALNSKGLALQELAGLAEKNRRQFLYGALAAYDEALKLTGELDRNHAQVLANRAIVLSDLAKLPQEDSRGRLYEALDIYNRALVLCRNNDQPLYAQTLTNRVSVLVKLSRLSDEDCARWLYEALTSLDEALSFQKNILPIAYAHTLLNRASVLQEIAHLRTEDRPKRLYESLKAFEEVEPLLSHRPLDYAQLLLNKSLLVHELANLSGENREQRLLDSLALLNRALPLKYHIRVFYANALLVKFNILLEFTKLPHYEQRETFRSALACIVEAQEIFQEYEEVDAHQRAKVFLSHLLEVMGGALFKECWEEMVFYEPLPRFPISMLVNALVINNSISANELNHRLQNDEFFKQKVEQLLTFALPDDEKTARSILLQDLLLAWLRIRDKNASKAYIHKHEVELLADEAEAELMTLRENNPDIYEIIYHIKLLSECQKQGIDLAYCQIGFLIEEHATRLTELLVTWMQCTTWSESCNYVYQYNTELLSEQAHTILKILLELNPGQEIIEQHLERLEKLIKTFSSTSDIAIGV